MKNKVFLLILVFGGLITQAQTPCTIGNMGSFNTLSANDYPHTNAGVTVNASTAGGVPTLSNTSYSCGGVSFATASPAWWLNAAGQSITLTFSQPVSSFSIIVNGTNNGEEFYVDVGPVAGGGTGCIQMGDFCTSGDWQLINGGAALIYNGTAASGSLISINNPGGATTYTLSHNGVGAGSRVAVVDCFVTASGSGGTVDIDPQSDTTVCDSFTFPAITGNGLSGNEAYYDGAGGTGTQYNPGDVFTTTGTTTMYIYDPGTGCGTDEEIFDLTINLTPDITNPGDQTVCDTYTLPAINGTNLTGNEAYYDAPNGGGTQYNPGDNFTTVGTTTLYVYDETGGTPNCFDEESFDVTISATPDITNPGNQTACAQFTFPAITGTNLTGNEAYYDAPNGGGTQYNVGDVYSTAGTVTIYIYDETGTTPNCSDEESFDLTIDPAPDVDPLTDVDVCDSYTLPAITGTGLTGNEAYFDAANAGGTQYAPGDVISTSTTMYIYDGSSATCYDEESFSINIELTPDVDPIADETVCGTFTFPAINGSDLTGNEAFYTGPGGTGTQYNPGDNITTAGTTTLYVYDETAAAGCSDEESFTVTIGSNLTISVSYTDITTCGGTDGVITISGVSANTTYDVTYSDDGSVVGPNALVSDGNGEIQITGLGEGQYTDFEVAFGACVGTDNTVIDLVEPTVPPLNLTGPTQLCEGETATLSTDLAGAHTWSDNSTNNTLDVTTSGKYWVDVDDGTGCIASDTIEVSFSDDIILDITPVPESCIDKEDGTVEIEVIQGSGPFSYSWLNGDTAATPIFPPGIYTVTVTNDYGCSYGDTIEIEAATEKCPEPSVYIPNIFSPNGDGVNDFFEVYGNEISALSMQIFDRWGKLVFYSTEVEAKWDGSRNGKPMNTAVFAYLIRVTFRDGTYEDYQGNVTLVRKK